MKNPSKKPQASRYRVTPYRHHPHLQISGVEMLLALLGAVSRCVVVVHWPLDILDGAFGGWLSAVLGMRLDEFSAAFGAQFGVQWRFCVALAGCATALIVGYETNYGSALFQSVLGGLCLIAAFLALRRGAGANSSAR
jgi:hypothetical protein